MKDRINEIRNAIVLQRKSKRTIQRYEFRSSSKNRAKRRRTINFI